MIDIPLPVASGAVIVVFTLLACWGVKESVYIAAAMTVIEVGGLIIVIAVGANALGDFPTRMAEMFPVTGMHFAGIMGGAFLAFFAFAGFENIVHLAEETEDVGRTLPRAVLLAIATSAILYMLVISIAVLAVTPNELAGSDAPLCLVVGCDQPMMAFFAPIAIIATLNGVLIEIVMMSRITYGMAHRGWLPRALGRVHPVRRTPILATLGVGTIVFALTTLIEFELLARATSALLLFVFLVVNLSLIRLKKRQPNPELSFRVPAWSPVVGAISSIILLGAEILS